MKIAISADDRRIDHKTLLRLPHRGKTADADRELAVVLVNNYLEDCGDAGSGFFWNREEERLARNIGALIGKVRRTAAAVRPRTGGRR